MNIFDRFSGFIFVVELKTISRYVDITANVCRDLQGLYREMSVRGFQIYRDYRQPAMPVKNFREKH